MVGAFTDGRLRSIAVQRRRRPRRRSSAAVSSNVRPGSPALVRSMRPPPKSNGSAGVTRVLLDARGLGRRLQRGLDLARRPVRVQREQQRRRAGDVRRRHRGARDDLVQVARAGPPAGPSGVGRVPGQDVQAGRGDVRLEEVAAGAAGGEVRDHVALPGGLGALGELRGRAGVGGQEGQQRVALRLVEVDRRQPVVVGHDVERAWRCRGSCPPAPPCLTLKPLQDAVRAALAGDDLAGEQAGRARAPCSGVGVRRRGGDDDRQRAWRRPP